MNIPKISFTGLSNLKIAQSREPKNWVGLYPSATGELKNGEIETREYKIRVDLTDDYSGRDYTDLLVEIAKAEKGLNTSYIKNAPPNRIELHMIKNKVVDDVVFKDYTYSTFKLNGEDIPIMGFKTLGLYTYLAKLTRNLKQNFILDPTQERIIDDFNQSIQDTAERFIDLMQ